MGVGLEPAGIRRKPKENAVALFTSTDGGTKYGNPIVRLVPRPEGILGMSESVVLSDGTLMTLYGHRKPVANAAPGGGGGGRGGLAARTPLPAANYWLDVITSTDGGESWNTANRIGDYWMNRPRSEGAVIPDIAVDPGSISLQGPGIRRLVRFPKRTAGSDALVQQRQGENVVA